MAQVPKPKINYEVRDQAAEKVLHNIGASLRNAMPAGYGFSLLIFTFGEGGNLFYTSNANRQDMINTMKEFIKKFEEN